MFLITGGAGFIGSHITEELVKQNQKVRVLDNFSSGKRDNLSHLLDKIELVEGDIRDMWTVFDAVDGVDFIVHEAALTSIQRSIDNPLTTNEVNISGTLNVLKAAMDKKVKRVVFASSSSVYGNTPKQPKVETMTPHPISPYAISKLAGEEYCLSFYKLYGLETVCLRYFNVFGPRQEPNSHYSAVIPKFISYFLEGRSPVVYGDGEQSRDFTFVSNVVEATLLACLKPEAAGRILNIATGFSHPLNQFIEILTQLTGNHVKPVYTKDRPGDVRDSKADIALAQKILSYQPKVDFQKGLKETVEYFSARNVNLVNDKSRGKTIKCSSLP
jgi:nucleoside-diphosphate-sugar epimerase